MAYSLGLGIKMFYRLTFILFIFSFSFESLAVNKVLIVRGESVVFENIISGLRDDLDGELPLVEMIINNKSSSQYMNKMFNKHSPRLIILMGNKAVNLYANFQVNHKEIDFPPAIALAALFIDKFSAKLKNTTAIRYEIPAVTSVVTMRAILTKPIKKVGVIYRAWMSDIIEENQRYCRAEGIELIALKLPNEIKDLSKEINQALTTLNKKVDALWILNDNHLLTRNALINAWLPQRGKSKLPAIVGIKPFITKIPLGSFAIVPDNYALGAQAAGIIFDIIDNDWQLETTKVQQPISIKKYINTARLNDKGIDYLSSMLNQVDEVVK